jgi:HNH endonuclease
MVCIFCLKEKEDGEMSDEHVFPDAIGGSLVIRSVCKPCNDYLGHSIDTHLTNHWLVQVQRLALGLRGKAKKVPNPLAHGTMADDPSQKLVYIFDADGTPESLYVVPNISREKLEDGRERISMRIDVSDRDQIPDMINKIRTRAGLSPLTTEEEERFRSTEKQSVPNPSMAVNVVIDLRSFQRAILKIAYELACEWLGLEYLTDPSAEAIRRCIAETSPDVDWATKHPVKGRVGMILGTPLFTQWDRELHSHIGFIEPDQVDLVCYVRIFQTFEGLVHISSEGWRYPAFEGRFIAIDPVARIERQSGYMEELLRLTRENG